MRQGIGSPLVQIMACRLFGAEPLSKPNAGLLSIGHLGTNFKEILTKIQNFSFTKIHLKISSAKKAAILSRWRWVNVRVDQSLNWKHTLYIALRANYWLPVVNVMEKICRFITKLYRILHRFTLVWPRWRWGLDCPRLSKFKLGLIDYHGTRNNPRGAVEYLTIKGLGLHNRYDAMCNQSKCHDDIVAWKHFPHHWPFVRRNHWQRVSDVELWCFLCCWPEQVIEKTMEVLVIRDAMMLMRRHCHKQETDVYSNVDWVLQKHPGFSYMISLFT